MKNINNESPNMSNILIEAESTVETVKDPKLREIAFSKILDLKLFGQISGQPFIKNKNSHNKGSSVPRTNPEGPKKWISELIDEQFFVEPKNMNDILLELKNRSHVLKPSSITHPLSTLCHEKRLRRVKQKGSDGKELWHWVNW